MENIDIQGFQTKEKNRRKKLEKKNRREYFSRGSQAFLKTSTQFLSVGYYFLDQINKDLKPKPMNIQDQH
jgi:hypothetical protein